MQLAVSTIVSLCCLIGVSQAVITAQQLQHAHASAYKEAKPKAREIVTKITEFSKKADTPYFRGVKSSFDKLTDLVGLVVQPLKVLKTAVGERELEKETLKNSLIEIEKIFNDIIENAIDLSSKAHKGHQKPPRSLHGLQAACGENLVEATKEVENVKSLISKIKGELKTYSVKTKANAAPKVKSSKKPNTGAKKTRTKSLSKDVKKEEESKESDNHQPAGEIKTIVPPNGENQVTKDFKPKAEDESAVEQHAAADKSTDAPVNGLKITEALDVDVDKRQPSEEATTKTSKTTDQKDGDGEAEGDGEGNTDKKDGQESSVPQGDGITNGQENPGSNNGQGDGGSTDNASQAPNNSASGNVASLMKPALLVVPLLLTFIL